MDKVNKSVHRMIRRSDSTRASGRVINKIPIEVLEMMFMDAIALASGRRVPSLLVALGTCKDTNNLYKIMQQMYRARNFVLTEKNQEHFKKLSLNHLCEIRHLTILEGINYQDANFEVASGINLKNNKIICINKLSTVTLEFEMNDKTIQPRAFANKGCIGESNLHQLATWIVGASKLGITEFSIVTPDGLKCYPLRYELNFCPETRLENKKDGFEVRVWELVDLLYPKGPKIRKR